MRTKGHDHEGQRVSRRTLFAGVSSIGLGGLLAACSGSSDVQTSTGETVSPSTTSTPSTSTASLDDLFADVSTCKLTETTTQGPYYFDADKVRSDIREDREGTMLKVAIKVQDSETCKALPNAVVEIWHCDAAGLYSGAEAMSSGSGGPGGQQGGGGGDLEPQDDKRYLRGAPRSPTPTTSCSSRRSGPAGTAAVPSTSTRWSTSATNAY